MNSVPPTDRSFGLSIGSVCIGIAVLLWWQEHPTPAAALLAAGTLLVGLGLAAPGALYVPNRLWWRFAQALAWMNARVLLTLFFALVLTPTGVAMRLFGRNPLRAPEAATNWGPYTARRRDPKHYEHLF